MLMVFGLVVVGLVITIALLIPLLRELRDLVQALPQIVADIRASDAFKSLDQHVDIGAEVQDARRRHRLQSA